MMQDMRSAPKDGSLILLHCSDCGRAIYGYWYTSPMVKWWRSVAGGWINHAVGWEPAPSTREELQAIYRFHTIGRIDL